MADIPALWNLTNGRERVMYSHTNAAMEPSTTFDTPFAGIGHGISVAAGDIIDRGGVASWDVYVSTDQVGTAYIYGHGPSGTAIAGTIDSNAMTGSNIWAASVAVTTYPRLSFALDNGASTADVVLMVRARGN